MPTKHALLSASKADRWLHCTPSARLEERVPDTPSVYAAEGTVAHAKAEEKLRNWLDGHPRKKVKCPDGEMDEATTAYRDYVMEIFNEEQKYSEDAKIFVEVQLDLSEWVPEGFGTADCVIVSDHCLHVIDFKYGKGVAVNVEHNPQLMLYAAGALRIYELTYAFQDVKLHIFQPRLDSISEWETTVDNIKDWLIGTVEPAAEMAIDGVGEQHPGAWCKFCKVKASCRARANMAMATAAEQKRLDGFLLTDAEIAALLPQLTPISDWCADLKEYATNEALAGTHYDGYKLVEGISRRKITDEPTAIETLEKHGYKTDQITKTSLLGISSLEKLVGKNELAALLDNCIEKPAGAPVLVPVTDKRPELKVAAAMDAFNEELEKKEEEKTK
ncbi:MAG: DUF2800 domain-containing protein [Erysipelotrichaceae bacterium]|nr:DUF2800 domain-containing protein [Erysipelotrichaceae bacterium]